MVRLSLANLFLHGFRRPRIREYDTLTELELWPEKAHVILANPPFMSPRGGIKPHDLFKVRSRRSEVLFLEYFLEHLTSRGRAAVIVPEGLLFQKGKARLQLRRRLATEALVAVVSLPGGVFQPYSGIKTSILILDKQLAPQAGTVAFFTVKNDGFSLNNRRLPVAGSDLPRVQQGLADFLAALRRRDTRLSPLASGFTVSRKKILADSRCSLRGEEYQQARRVVSPYPVVPLGDVAEVIPGQSPPGTSYNERGEGVPFHQGKTEFGEIYLGPARKWTTKPTRLAAAGAILISVRAPVGPVNITRQEICVGRGLAVIKPREERILKYYLFHLLRYLEPEITGKSGAAFAAINRRDLEQISIPLPPLEVQREIVRKIGRQLAELKKLRREQERRETRIREILEKIGNSG
jgi:type I restriction enzyme M protein